MKDYYAILGVSHTAELIDIKTAYKRLAVKHHPDKNLHDDNATERFKVVLEAYEALSDEKRRRVYDASRGIHNVPKHDGPRERPPASSTSFNWTEWNENMAKLSESRQRRKEKADKEREEFEEKLRQAEEARRRRREENEKRDAEIKRRKEDAARRGGEFLQVAFNLSHTYIFVTVPNKPETTFSYDPPLCSNGSFVPPKNRSGGLYCHTVFLDGSCILNTPEWDNLEFEWCDHVFTNPVPSPRLPSPSPRTRQEPDTQEEPQTGPNFQPQPDLGPREGNQNPSSDFESKCGDDLESNSDSGSDDTASDEELALHDGLDFEDCFESDEGTTRKRPPSARVRTRQSPNEENQPNSKSGFPRDANAPNEPAPQATASKLQPRRTGGRQHSGTEPREPVPGSRKRKNSGEFDNGESSVGPGSKKSRFSPVSRTPDCSTAETRSRSSGLAASSKKRRCSIEIDDRELNINRGFKKWKQSPTVDQEVYSTATKEPQSKVRSDQQKVPLEPGNQSHSAGQQPKPNAEANRKPNSSHVQSDGSFSTAVDESQRNLGSKKRKFSPERATRTSSEEHDQLPPSPESKKPKLSHSSNNESSTAQGQLSKSNKRKLLLERDGESRSAGEDLTQPTAGFKKPKLSPATRSSSCPPAPNQTQHELRSKKRKVLHEPRNKTSSVRSKRLPSLKKRKVSSAGDDKSSSNRENLSQRESGSTKRKRSPESDSEVLGAASSTTNEATIPQVPRPVKTLETRKHPDNKDCGVPLSKRAARYGTPRASQSEPRTVEDVEGVDVGKGGSPDQSKEAQPERPSKRQKPNSGFGSRTRPGHKSNSSKAVRKHGGSL